MDSGSADNRLAINKAEKAVNSDYNNTDKFALPSSITGLVAATCKMEKVQMKQHCDTL